MKTKTSLVFILYFLSLLSLFSAVERPKVYVWLTRHPERGQSKDMSIGHAALAGEKMGGTWFPREGEPLVIEMTAYVSGDKSSIALWFSKDLKAAKLSPQIYPRPLRYLTLEMETPIHFEYDGSQFTLLASLKGWPHQTPNQ